MLQAIRSTRPGGHVGYVGVAHEGVNLPVDELFFAEVHLHGGPAPVRRFLPELFDYTQEDFTRSGQRYDVILDIAGNHPWPDIRRAITPEGTFVLIGHYHYGGSGHRWFGSLGRFAKLIVISPFVSQLHPFRGAKDPGGSSARHEGAHRDRQDHSGHRQDVPVERGPGSDPIPGIGTGPGEGHHHRVSLRAEPLTATRSHGSRGHRVLALRSAPWP
jgi:hypothetical protein